MYATDEIIVEKRSCMTRIRDRLQPLFTTELFRYDELKKMFFTLAVDQFFIYAIGILSSAMVSSVGEEAIARVRRELGLAPERAPEKTIPCAAPSGRSAACAG